MPPITTPCRLTPMASSTRLQMRLFFAAAVPLMACGGQDGPTLHGWPPAEEIRPYGRPEPPPPVEPDLPSEPELPPEPAPPTEPPACTALIEKLCALWGVHSDSCLEAQTKQPDNAHVPTRLECERLLESLTQKQRGNPCLQLTQSICHDYGRDSEACQAARARQGILSRGNHGPACRADLIWRQAQKLRR